MSVRFRVKEERGVFYVERKYFGLFWTKIGKPCPHDGGWAGPEQFRSRKKAEDWITELIFYKKVEDKLKKLPTKVYQERKG